MQTKIHRILARNVFEAARKPRIDGRSGSDGTADAPERDGGGIRVDLLKQPGVVVRPDEPAHIIESGLIAALSNLPHLKRVFIVHGRAILGEFGADFQHAIHIFALGFSKLRLGVGLSIGRIQAFVQGTEGISGCLRINLSRILVEEVKRIIEALFLTRNDGAFGDIPDALARIQSIDRPPIEVQRDIELIQRARPSLVHLRAPKQGQFLGCDQVWKVGRHRRGFPAEVVTARKCSVLDAEAVLERFGCPVPHFRKIMLTLFLGFGCEIVEQQADFQVGIRVEKFRIHGEGLEAELLPRRTFPLQTVFAIQRLSLVSTFISSAACFDLYKGNPLLFIFGVAADALGHFREETMEIHFVFWVRIVGVVGEFILMPLIVRKHLGHAFFIDPVRRFRTSLKG